MNKQLEKDLQEEINRIAKLHWQEIRQLELFKLVKRKYEFGERSSMESNPELYADLQASRGIGFNQENPPTSIELCEQIKKEIPTLYESNLNRIKDIEQYDVVEQVDKFFEIGFRHPVLLEYMYSKYGLYSKGYDILRLSVLVAKALGYNAEEHDMNNHQLNIDLGGKAVVVSYHCFEHLYDPLASIKKVHNSMDKGSYFHVEVPVEHRDTPNVRTAHMFVFQRNDLLKMMKIAGFKVVNSINEKHDRVLAMKD